MYSNKFNTLLNNSLFNQTTIYRSAVETIPNINANAMNIVLCPMFMFATYTDQIEFSHYFSINP